MPKGTQLEAVAHFDNSENNAANPDPSKTVRWGQQTWDEMLVGWFNYTSADEGIGLLDGQSRR